MAAGANQKHVVHNAAADQNNVIAGAAVAAVVMDVAEDAEIADCNGHSGHKTGAASKKCCASMCCAADVVWNCVYWHVSGNQVTLLWSFTTQFVMLKHATGLDRPPDFLA